MITGLHHYALSVPGLDVADDFLRGFGLETAAEAGGLVARCPGRDQEQVRMIEAPAKKLHHLAFTATDLDPLRERLERAGVPEIDPPEGGTEHGVWFRDPEGTPIQLLETPPAKPRDIPEVLFNVGAVHHRFDTPAWQQAEDVLPRRLGHMLLFSGRHEQQVEFWTDVMGLAISDRITGKVTFLNTGAGDHHVFGFITSSHPGFHHASYEVPSIDAIGAGANRMHRRLLPGHRAARAGTRTGSAAPTTAGRSPSSSTRSSGATATPR
jgi:catechol 2,3-dioxygenase-like lactoylglutathione lyase family enzyme